MKWTTVIAAVAALFVGTQTADAGLLDFLRLNRSNKCEVKTAKPKCAKPAAPKCAKPAAPKVRSGLRYAGNQRAPLAWTLDAPQSTLYLFTSFIDHALRANTTMLLAGGCVQAAMFSVANSLVRRPS